MKNLNTRAGPRDVPPRRPLAKVRRPQILAAAVALLREDGLWSVRVADVAERAGTSATAVIYYFGTKDELFKAAIADADAEFYAPCGRSSSGWRPASQRLAWLIVRSSRSEWVLWMDLWVYARRHPDLLPTRRGFSERWSATIAGGRAPRTGARTSSLPSTPRRWPVGWPR